MNGAPLDPKGILRNHNIDDRNLNELYEKFIFKLEKRTIQLDKLNKKITITLKILPVIGAGLSALFALINEKEIALWISLAFTVAFLLVAFLESYVPSGLIELEQEAQKLQLQKVVRILATEVDLFLSLKNIDHDDDTEIIEQISQYLNGYISEAVLENWSRLNRLVLGFQTQNKFDSPVYLKDVPHKLYDNLLPVAEKILDACQIFFGSADYSIKIYLKTKHAITKDGKIHNIEMLSSLVKCPITSQSKVGGGRSWLKCSGDKATVWKLLENKPEIICNVDEERKSNPKEVYPSIAYIKLPKGIGVLTIVSSSRNTFADRAIITEDIKNSLMITTHELTSKALADTFKK